MTTHDFHIWDGYDLLKDTTGVDLHTVEYAEEEAGASACDLLADNIKQSEQLDHRRFEVWDEQGVAHFLPPFRGAIGIE